jgi:hypothetical protein
MMPRSIAPTESRLADSPRNTVIMTARNSATGIVAETMRAQRRSPRNTHWIKKINATPNNRLCNTVCTVMATRSPRSYQGSILTPAGRLPSLLMRSIAARTRVTTSMVRSSFCISTMPVTMSPLPSRAEMPSRGAKPICTFATSLSSTGTPPCCDNTIFPISSSELTTPRPRTLTDCSPRAIVRPPTLELPEEIAFMICGRVNPYAIIRLRSISA